MYPSPRESESPRLLITAGPTYEPIDAVRFIGNRSSGRLGVALADHAASHGWQTHLLLGPTAIQPSGSRVRLSRFRTTADLEALLKEHGPDADVLIMAAAVADYRPKVSPEMLNGKHRRVATGMMIELESTPDLLAGCASRRRPGQVIVGFALEPRAEMLDSARRKLERKKVDLIVANPLETMDGPTIEATVVGVAGGPAAETRSTPGAIDKREFAPWLLAIVAEALHGAKA